jgi:hypothetical protein
MQGEPIECPLGLTEKPVSEPGYPGAHGGFPMSNRSTSGRATGMVVLLLIVMFAAGGWNYHRNLQITQEAEGLRPFASYAVADLEALREAYQSDLEKVRVRFDRAQSQRVRPLRDVGSMSRNVAQFAQTTRTSSAIRNAAGKVSDREGQIAELDRELDLRSRFGEGIKLHLKRLITI